MQTAFWYQKKINGHGCLSIRETIYLLFIYLFIYWLAGPIQGITLMYKNHLSSYKNYASSF